MEPRAELPSRALAADPMVSDVSCACRGSQTADPMVSDVQSPHFALKTLDPAGAAASRVAEGTRNVRSGGVGRRSPVAALGTSDPVGTGETRGPLLPQRPIL